jgi:hypothetical protein
MVIAGRKLAGRAFVEVGATRVFCDRATSPAGTTTHDAAAAPSHRSSHTLANAKEEDDG